MATYDSLDETLDAKSEQLAEASAKAFRASAIETLERAGRQADYNIEPVVESFTPVTRRSDGTYGFRVEHEVASIFEFGSAPHTIEGEDGPLVFTTPDGQEVFVDEVDHPGTDALLFMTKSKNELNADQALQFASDV